MDRALLSDRPEPVMTDELAGVRNAVLLIAVLFVAKAAAVILFLLPATSLAGETGFLAWLGQNYAVRICLLVVTGVALYGTLAAFALSSLPTTRTPAKTAQPAKTEAAPPLPAHRPARDARPHHPAKRLARTADPKARARRPGQG